MKLRPWTLALLGVFILGAVFSLRLLGDSDLGFHLRGGKEVVENHQIPRTDSYTYTREGAPYVDLHWGYQTLLYLVHKAGGYRALSLLNAFLVLTVLLLSYRRMKIAGAPLFMAVPLFLLFLVSSEIRFQVRPEVVSWILMSLVLLVLESRAKGGRDLLFLLPVIHLVWANTEGLFPIGWFLMGAYLLSSLIHGPGWDKKLLSMTLLSIAACLVNPFFLKGFLHPFELLGTLGSSSVFKGTIVEFQPPWKLLDLRPFGPTWAVLAYTLYLGFVLILAAVTFRSRKIHEILIAAVFLYFSATANRNIPLFLLATLPLAVVCWKELKWEWLKIFHERFLSTPLAAWGFLALALILAGRVATNAYFIDQGRTIRTGIGLDREYQPVEAAEFLLKNGLEGRVLNEMNLGGWLVWSIPQPIFVDGRLEVMGAEFYSHQMAAKMREGGLASLMARYKPDIIVMMGTDTPQWLYDLKGMSDWRLAFVSRSGIVYLRKGYAPQVPALAGEKLLTEIGIPRMGQEEVRALLAAQVRDPLGTWLEGTFLPQDYPRGLMRIAMLYHSLEDRRTAEPLYLEAIRLGEGKYFDEYLNLGMLYYQEGRSDLARVCVEQVLKMKPGEPQAKNLSADLP